MVPGRFQKEADPLGRVTGPRMNPSVDVGRPPRPFRHLRMTERCTPDPSSSRAPVHSALVQKSVTRHHQPRRPAYKSDARGRSRDLASAGRQKDGRRVALWRRFQAECCVRKHTNSYDGMTEVLDSAARVCVHTQDRTEWAVAERGSASPGRCFGCRDFARRRGPLLLS